MAEPVLQGSFALICDGEGVSEADQAILAKNGFKSSKLWANAALDVAELNEVIKSMIPPEGNPGYRVRAAALRGAWNEAREAVKLAAPMAKNATAAPIAATAVNPGSNMTLATHKMLMDKHIAKYNRAPPEDKYPAHTLIASLVKMKGDGTFGTTPLKDMITQAHFVEKR